MNVLIIKAPTVETETLLPSGRTRVYIHAEFEVDPVSRENNDVYIDEGFISNLFYALRDDWDYTIQRLAKC
jgi:hypothetical protein